MAKVKGQPLEHFLHWKQADKVISSARRSGREKAGSTGSRRASGMAATSNHHS
jgi:hypothetical protein